MSIFKCKMCGGTLEINNNETVGVCEYCGTKQTLPKLNDEKKSNLYDRASHFRRNNEFDKAMSIYEQILNQDNADAESYWSIVLCRYGIEYVEDPASHKRIPTVNRAQFTSIFDDEDYKSALQYADGYQREVYENEANAINEIQKGILAISQQEEPFDVFICYKETDHQGRRTQDSVLAQELYYELVEQGFKVFFARITLEDKLGTAYEPYIFAALNSAKVMVVLGTKSEHFNAVWVKNEWSRYLALIKNGADKMLIPAYRDMDPYDLPEEFSHLQAQDMSKLGFMQDLVRGISKIVTVDTPTFTEGGTFVASNASEEPLLKRAFMFLEDGDFERADEFCEQVLNMNPENARAYLGKLLSELKVKKQESLRDYAEPFDDRNNYQKALRFADSTLASELSGYIQYIKERNETERKEKIYVKAVNIINTAGLAPGQYKIAVEAFQSIIEYKDAKELLETSESLWEQAETSRKDAIYEFAKQLMSYNTSESYIRASGKFESIVGWKDAEEQIAECQRKIAELKEAEEEALKRKQEENRRIIENARIEAEKKKKKQKKVGTIIILVLVLFVGLAVLWKNVIVPSNKYNKAVEFIQKEKYNEAVSILMTIPKYKDSEKIIKEHIGKFATYISVGKGRNVVGLKSDGTVVTTGNNDDGQCNVGEWKDIVSISAGGYYTIGLKSDGTVVATGNNDNGQCNVGEWKDIVSISAGSHHTVGLKSDGTVVATGNNGDRQCNVGEWKDIVSISAGAHQTVGLKSDGTVMAVGFGSGAKRDAGEWKDIVAISAGGFHIVGLKSDGTVMATGDNYFEQCNVGEWKDIVSVSTWENRTVGLKADGTLVDSSGEGFLDSWNLFE